MDIQDKVEIIREEILGDVKKEIEEKIQKETKTLEEDYNDFKINLKKRKQDIINKYKDEADTKKEQIISKGVLENKKKIIQKKHKLYDELLKMIKERLIEYRKEDEYNLFLKKLIIISLNNLNSKEIVLSFNKKDKEIYLNQVADDIDRNYSDYNIIVDDKFEDILGGVIVKTQNGREIIVNTFELLIENIEEEISKKFQKEIIQSKIIKNR